MRPCLALENVHQLVDVRRLAHFLQTMQPTHLRLPRLWCFSHQSTLLRLFAVVSDTCSGTYRFFTPLCRGALSVGYPRRWNPWFLGRLSALEHSSGCACVVRTNPHATILAVTLGGLTLIRVYYILHGPLNLSPDEAHYWNGRAGSTGVITQKAR